MRRVLLWGFFALGLVGCTDPYRPTRREVPVTSVPRGASASPEGKTAPEALGREVAVGAIRLTAPENWIRTTPRSAFIAAEFRLPSKKQESQDGRLTVSVAGGTVEANVERWKGQFEEKPAGQRQQVRVREIAGVQVTIVDLSGTYRDQSGPFAPTVQRKGYRMLAAIIPAAGQLHFVKAYGPETTMAQHLEAFEAFLQSLEVK